MPRKTSKRSAARKVKTKSRSRVKKRLRAQPIPKGYHNVTPYLIINGATQALEFYKTAFGAREKLRIPGAEGRIGHAEIIIGDSHIMLADEHPEVNARAPQPGASSPVGIMLYIKDVDTVFKRAVAGGAQAERAPADQFYGDRTSTIVDPFGHRWFISTHIEDVSPKELKRRMQEQQQ